MGVRVEADAAQRGGDALHERGGGDGVGLARPALVAAVGRRLADRDERAAIAGLDPCDPGARELRVVRRADDLPGGVELGHEERGEIRLVPDRVEAHERVAGVPARVSGRDRPREVLEVRELARHGLRLLAAVRPAGVPHRVISTSSPRSCALRMYSSTSPNWYAGSNGFVACAGAPERPSTSRRQCGESAASLPRARSIASVRVSSQRSIGSSWKPTHIRSAAVAAGTSSTAASEARKSRRTTNRTRTSLGGVGKAGP